MADVLNFTVNRAFDINGDPVPGAQARFFDSGTSSPRTVYADQDASVPHPTPLLSDADGIFPPVFVASSGPVAVEIADEDGVMLDGYPMPVAVRVPTGGADASSVAFSPTGDIQANNVQEAIEQVQSNLVAPLAAYGLGVTGNAPLIANLDAVDTASGMYRYDVSTIGAFPSGINAVDGGEVVIWRRNNSNAVMFLVPAVSDAMPMRRLVNGTWQTWANGIAPTATDAQMRAGTSRGAFATPFGVEQHSLANDFGKDQSIYSYGSSRQVNTTYVNSTGRPIWVSLQFGGTSFDVGLRPTGTEDLTNIFQGSGNFAFPVPDGFAYRVSATSQANKWVELR